MADPDVPPPPPVELVEGFTLPSWRRHPPDSASEEAWRNGMLWAVDGRYDRAFAWWNRIPDPAYAARVRAARGQSLRELGLHERAEVEDRAGLTIAGRPEDRVALLVGLVADAVGRGDQDLMRRFIEASRAVAVLPESIDAELERIRYGWVAAEVQLLTGEGEAMSLLPGASPDGSELLIPERYDHGSEFHLAKGLLFAGMLTRDIELLDEAVERAPRGLLWAVHLGRDALGAEDGVALARAAWVAVVAPPRHAPEVARGAAARHLA